MDEDDFQELIEKPGNTKKKMIMKKLLLKILWYICLFCAITTNAEQKSGIRFRGSMYSDLGLLHTVHSISEDEADFAGMSVLSVNLKNTNRKFGKVEGLFDVIIPYGSMIERYIPDSIDSDSSLLDLYKLFSFGKAPVLLDIRKLYLSMYLPFADITIGRQIINFGKGFVFSPIDVFSSVELFDINYRRRGSDIANIRIPFSDLAGLDITTELPFIDDNFSTAIKLFATILDFDFSLVGMYRNAGDDTDFEDEAVVGLTFKGDLEVGIYGEAVTHILTDSGEVFFEGMFGADYSIKDKWYFVAEYLYKQYNWSNSIWGEHNLFGSIRYNINDIMNVSGNVIYDFEHESTLGILQWYYNILQNVNTIIYIQGTDSSIGQFLMYSLRVEVKF